MAGGLIESCEAWYGARSSYQPEALRCLGLVGGVGKTKPDIIDFLPPLASKVHRLTSDKGNDFSAHQSIAQSLAVNFYLAHPDA